MTTLRELVDVIPEATLAIWPDVAAVAPSDSVLMGGTALAVHLRHCRSRDLDVFTYREFDPEAVRARLEGRGKLAVERIEESTLNGTFNGARVQFLWARDQRELEEPETVEGLAVAAIGDLYATKLNAVSGRGELRDYFDLMRIERDTGRTIEEGVSLFMARYGIDTTSSTLNHVIGSLGYLDDLAPDPHLAAEFGDAIVDQVKEYWRKRQPRLVRNMDVEAATPSDASVREAMRRYRGR